MLDWFQQLSNGRQLALLLLLAGAIAWGIQSGFFTWLAFQIVYFAIRHGFDGGGMPLRAV